MNLPAPPDAAPLEGRVVGPGDLTPAAGIPPTRNAASVYLASLDAGTSRPTMRQALDLVAGLLSGGQLDHETLPWHLLRFEHTSAVAGQIVTAYAPSTANKILSALSQVIVTCWRLGYYDAETRDRVKDYARSGGDRPTAAEAGRQIQPGELRTLFASCAEQGGALGVRDAALLALLYGAGLRRVEAGRLDVASYDEPTGKITVHGKRNKVRIVPAADGSRQALTAWLDLRGRDPGPLLLPLLKSGEINPDRRRMSLSGLSQAADKRARLAGVTNFALHDLRRTYIGDLLDAGVDLSTASKLAGHANTNTTAGYDRRGERAKQRAAGLLHVPYQPATHAPERKGSTTT